MSIRAYPPNWEEGIATFLRAPMGDLEDLREGMVAVAGVGYDNTGTGQTGTRYGPQQIRLASLRYATSLGTGPQVEPNTGQTIDIPAGDLAGKLIDLGDTNAFQTDWPRMETYLRGCMYEVSRRGAFPIFLGGDHLITHPLVLGYHDGVAERGEGNIGYIQFSSQLDLGLDDPLWGRAWRGATARRILDSGAIRRQNVAFIGTNGYLPKDQVALAEELEFNLFSLDQIDDVGIEQVTRQALDMAGDGCDAIYVSIDADVVDGVYLQSADSPAFRGLTVGELEHAMKIIGESKAGALDIVGCNPTFEYGSQGRTSAQWAAWLAFLFTLPRLLD